MLLSIIIPVYNVEKYLEQCIDSVIDEKIENVEIILVNDGSTDSSYEICNQYASKFKNIKVIHKENGGLSDARNCGIDNSCGKYLMFIDSDDYIAGKALKEILDIIKNELFDVLMYTYYEFDENIKRNKELGKNTELESGNYKVNNIILEQILKNTNELWPAWKFIVRRSFLINNDIQFKKGFLHEDVDYTVRVISCMEDFYYLEKPIYYYRVNRKGSIMNSKSLRSLLDTSQIIIDLKKYLDNKNIDNKIKNIIMDRLSRTFFTVLELYSKGNYEDKQNIIKNIKNNLYLLYSSTNRKHRIFVGVSKILGIRMALNLYTKIMR